MRTACDAAPYLPQPANPGSGRALERAQEMALLPSKWKTCSHSGSWLTAPGVCASGLTLFLSLMPAEINKVIVTNQGIPALTSQAGNKQRG